MATSTIKNPIIQTARVTCNNAGVSYCIGSLPNFRPDMTYSATMTGGTNHGQGVTTLVFVNRSSGIVQCQSVNNSYTSDDNVVVDVIGIKT